MALSNWLTDEQLKTLLKQYFDGKFHLDGSYRETSDLINQIQSELLDPQVIDTLPEGEYLKKAEEIYRSVVSRPMYYKAFTDHPKEIRAAFRYLIESEDDLDTKLTAVLDPDGLHRLVGLGISYWSVMIRALDPQSNPRWTKKTEEALTDLGMNYWKNNDSIGKKYAAIAKAQKGLVELSDSPEADLFSIDHFMHYVTVLDGKEILQQWRINKNAGELGEPFCSIFQDRAQAEWSLNFMAETLQKLGVQSKDNERFAISYRSDISTIRLLYGNWLILGFKASGEGKEPSVEMALLEDLFTPSYDFYSQKFSQKPDEPQVILAHNLPFDKVKTWEDNQREVHQKSIEFIAARFSHWKRSIWRKKHHVHQLGEALFTPDTLDHILTEGFQITDIPLDIEDEISSGPEVNPEGYFSPITFESLKGLHHNPTKDFYMGNRDDFKSYVEEPLKQLMKDVALKLPDPILAIMETEKRIFSRFLKNDYGQGGVWDFYWSAYYYKGRKRTDSAQLICSLKYDRFVYGFSIADFASEIRRRFEINCLQNQDTLRSILQNPLSDESFVYCAHDDFSVDQSSEIITEEFLSFDQFLRDPAATNFNVSIFWTPKEILKISKTELQEKMLKAYIALFPLILLAIYDNPIPKLREYLEQDEDEYDLEKHPVYPISVCSDETGFDEEMLDRWVRAINRKGQAIIFGPPGTGKTYIAEQIARHMVGGGDGIMDLVQFHPSYAYEDFILGIRPKSRPDGSLYYPLVNGRFLEFCEKAAQRSNTSVLIIDEINRANLSRVFGELMYLLEYRKAEIPLAGGQKFSIPPNIRIIGTMNTADRSIALVDHALRRRFAFLELAPNYDILRKYHRKTGFPVEGLITVLEKLNRTINDRHYSLGITFFLREKIEDEIKDIWKMEVEPYLDEFFFDRPGSVDEFRWEKIARDIL